MRVLMAYPSRSAHTRTRTRIRVSVRKVPLLEREHGVRRPSSHITVHYRARCGGSLVCIRATRLVLLATSAGVMPLCTTPRRCRWRCTASTELCCRWSTVLQTRLFPRIPAASATNQFDPVLLNLCARLTRWTSSSEVLVFKRKKRISSSRTSSRCLFRSLTRWKKW